MAFSDSYSVAFEHATVPGPTYIQGPVVGGTTVHTLKLYLSEDYYLTDATVQVAINGQNQFVSAQAVIAKKADNQQEVFTFTGTWASPPTVVVTFTNDAWGGGSKDRNLYLEAAIYDGVPIAGCSYSFLRAEKYTFRA